MSIKIPTDAYCTLEDVQALLPNRKYDGNSRPTLEGAEEIIKDIAREINGILRGLGFSPPLTGTTDKAELKSMNKYGAAALIESATLIGVQGTSPIIESYQKKYDDSKESLKSGEWELADAGAAESAEAEGSSDFADGEDREDSVFQFSEDQRKNQF